MSEAIALPHVMAVIEEGMSKRLHIGAQLYVSLEGQPIADLALGEARPGVPMTPQTLMPWFSCTKPLAAVALAQLWEKGRLHPDDPVIRFIPEFGVRGKESITLRHLLTHTAGLRHVSAGWPERSWEEAVRALCNASMESDWVPGERAGYHIASTWFILGEVIQRVARQPYGEYVREQIMKPLGMRHSWIEMTPKTFAAYGDRVGIMHKKSGGELRPVEELPKEWTLPNPAGGGHGPIRDLARFYEMLLLGGEWEGKQILSSQTVDALTARHRVGLQDETFQVMLDWGLGFIVNSNYYGKEPLPYGFGRYASRRTFGHGGAQSSVSFCDPVRRLVVAVVFNGMPGEPAHNRRNWALNTALYKDLGWASS